jgi:hypothetical protein
MNSPIFCLNLAGIFQDADINKQIGRRVQTSGQINVGPLTLVSGQQIAVQTNVFLFLGAQTTLAVFGIHGLRFSSCLIVPNDIYASPAHVFQLVGAHTMVCQETTFVAAHAQVVDKKSTRCGRILRGVERRAKGFQKSVDLSVEFADFAYYGTDELSLVGRELRESLGSLCMLHLDLYISQWK